MSVWAPLLLITLHLMQTGICLMFRSLVVCMFMMHPSKSCCLVVFISDPELETKCQSECNGLQNAERKSGATSTLVVAHKTLSLAKQPNNLVSIHHTGQQAVSCVDSCHMTWSPYMSPYSHGHALRAGTQSRHCTWHTSHSSAEEQRHVLNEL